MVYEDIKTKHNLTNAQLLHLHALCARFGVNTAKIVDWNDSLTVIGDNKTPRVHIRHTDIVLHIEAFDRHGETLRGSSWALTPDGEQYAARGIAEI